MKLKMHTIILFFIDSMLIFIFRLFKNNTCFQIPYFYLCTTKIKEYLGVCKILTPICFENHLKWKDIEIIFKIKSVAIYNHRNNLSELLSFIF